ncbi:MAG: D-alanyl-D-alanine carboxypeptidase, partial [Rhodospirillales bacterium]|nr:D-alanyl-D-alanine carboxypeptidase [Rhodospirillales bacterium]
MTTGRIIGNCPTKQSEHPVEKLRSTTPRTLWIGALWFVVTAILIELPATTARAFETSAREAVIIEAATGRILFEKNADQRMPPASMSKLMTVYMMFSHLQDGSLSLEDTFKVSENAWRRGGAKSGSSTMFLEPNKQVSIESLLRGIIVQSGNDACIVVAEGISGSEPAFAEAMTVKAREIGLTGSHFANATGWPDPDHYMTPVDLARLALKTIEEFPELYHYYSEEEFTYNGIRQRNRNPLLYKGIGADGLKTGHTEEAGYGLTSSAIRNDRRIIAVLNGMASKKERSSESERLIDWAFREFQNYALFKSGDVVTDAEVWLGTAGYVPLVITQDVLITLPRKVRKHMKVSVRYEGPIAAPIVAGTPLAELIITTPGETDITIPLVAGSDVEALGL